MKRSGSIKRNKPLARGGRVRSVNHARATKRRARDFGSEAEGVEAMEHCVCCEVSRACFGDIVAAHIVSRGAGGGRFDIVNMCASHHGEQHLIGVKTFEQRYGLDLRRLADDTALGMLDPLGIRGLARRWADWLTGADSCSACGNDGVSVTYAESGADICGTCGAENHCTQTVPCPLGRYERGALFGWVDRRAERVWSEQPEAIGESAVLAVLVTELGLTIDAAGDLLDAATEGRP